MKVSMIPDNSVKMIHASQDDVNRRWEFELYDEDGLIDVSSVSEQMVYPVYVGGTEQILPENTSTPTTSPILADIQYPDELREEQEFLYRECPSAEDGQARIKGIVGNTVKLNQLVDSIGISQTLQDITFTNNNDGTFTLNGSFTYTDQNLFKNINFVTTNSHKLIELVANHKYLFFGKYEKVGIAIGLFNSSLENLGYIENSYLNPLVDPIIYTHTGSNSLALVRFQIRKNVNFNNEKAWVCCADLTTMFGAGNEPQTAAEFFALYPLGFYAYTQGTLLPFMGEQIKTTGKNLIDSSALLVGSIGSSGQDLSGNARIRTDSYIRVLSGHAYTLQTFNSIEIYRVFEYADGNADSFIRYLDVNRSTYSFNTTAETNYVRVLYRKSDNASMTLDDLPTPQMEFGSTATSYEPYKESIVNLPTTTYFPDGMKSAGDVYDEQTENKATERVRKLLLNGSENWWKANEFTNCVQFGLDLAEPAKSTPSNVKGNVISASFETETGDFVYARGIEGVTIDPAGRLRISALKSKINGSTVTDFKTWLASNNQEVHYELAEPVETPIASASLVSQNQEIPMVVEDDKLVAYSTQEITEKSGFHDAKIKLSNDGVAYSAKFTLHVERKP